MRGVVYVDILFFVNAVIGYFLLRAAAKLAGCRTGSGRLLLGAAAAGLSSLLLLLPPLPVWLMWGAKIGSGVLIVFAGFQVHTIREFLKSCFWYILLNITFSGVVFAAIYAGASRVRTNNLAVYFHVSPLLLIACITGTYLAVRLFEYAFGRPMQARTIPFTAQIEGGSIQGMALVDTGFSVRDPLTGTPAFLLSFPSVRDALPPALLHTLSLYFTEGAIETGGTPMHLIPTQTAAGTRALPAVRVQELCLETDGARRTYTSLCAVFTQEALSDGTFCAIVPAEMP